MFIFLTFFSLLLYTREATFTKIILSQLFSCTSANMVGVYVRENAERWVLPLPELVWNIKAPVTQAPQAPMALTPICFWYFKPIPAEEALICQHFLLHSPSLYSLGNMKTAETKENLVKVAFLLYTIHVYSKLSNFQNE